MTEYNVNFTDISKAPLTVRNDTVSRGDVDITLFGRSFQNYGEEVNEDLLNLLENFACPEDPATISELDAVPDFTRVSKNQLRNPIEGQFWFNSTRKTIYYFDGAKWVPVPRRGSYAANWGRVMDGEQLPRPVNQYGQPFEYTECIWSVSPAGMSGRIDYLDCSADSNAVVTMRYRFSETENIVSGIANYLIIGIRGNTNTGMYVSPVAITQTPTPTPTPTPFASPTPTPSKTPAVTLTPTPTISTTPSPTPSVTVTPSPTEGYVPTPTPTPTTSGPPLPTYCYDIMEFCMGYADSGEEWTELKSGSGSTPAAGVCATSTYVTSHSASGRINVINDSIDETYPAVKMLVRLSGSDGSVVNEELILVMDSGADVSANQTFSPTLYVGSQTFTMTINVNWYKSSNSSTSAIGTLSATHSFDPEITHC